MSFFAEGIHSILLDIAYNIKFWIYLLKTNYLFVFGTVNYWDFVSNCFESAAVEIYNALRNILQLCSK